MNGKWYILLFALCILFFQLGTKLTVENYTEKGEFLQPHYDIGFLTVMASLFFGAEILYKIATTKRIVKEICGKRG